MFKLLYNFSISHTSKVMLKIIQARLQQYMNWELPDAHLDLEKAEEPEIKLPTYSGSWKKQESSRKTSISALLTMPKPWLSGSQSDQISCSVVSDSLRPHESQHARPPCPLPTPRVHSDSRPSSQWCHPAISSSVVHFSSCPQCLPASESFPMSQLFTWGGQSPGVSASASFPPKKSQGWSPSEWTGWISLQSEGLSRVFSNTTVQRHQFFSAQPSLWSNSHIHIWLLGKPYFDYMNLCRQSLHIGQWNIWSTLKHFSL